MRESEAGARAIRLGIRLSGGSRSRLGWPRRVSGRHARPYPAPLYVRSLPPPVASTLPPSGASRRKAPVGSPAGKPRLGSAPAPGATRESREILPPRRTRFVNPHRGSPRPLLCFGCVEERHDENAQTETNQQGKTDDEAVFHTRSLRSYQAAQKGPSAVTPPLAGYPARLGTRCGVPPVRLDPPAVGTPPCAPSPSGVEGHLGLFEQLPMGGGPPPPDENGVYSSRAGRPGEVGSWLVPCVREQFEPGSFRHPALLPRARQAES